jgi:hypothetical protein
MGASGVSQRGRKVGVGKKAGVGVGVGENNVVVGIGVDDNAGVGITLETVVGVDMRSVDMEVSKELKIADMELTVRDGVGDITREGIIIELEGEANVVGCGVGVLDTAEIWLVSEKGSNDMKSPEPKSPEPSGVIETIGALLLDIVLVVLGVMEETGMLLLIMRPGTLDIIGVMETVGVLLPITLLAALIGDAEAICVLLLIALLDGTIDTAVVCVISIRLMGIPEEVKGCDVN